MTYRAVFTSPLPTLALVALGASESTVGLQSAFVAGALTLQLPTLRWVARISKRRILVGAHAFGVFGALPLIAFRTWSDVKPDVAISVVMLCFAPAAAGIGASETVWFPMLRAYVEPERIGRFFGTLRSGWHLTLIVYFLGSQVWLDRHPGDFAPLFAVGAACGLLRIALISRLPERSERTGAPIRIAEAVALLRDAPMRRYLGGVCSTAAAKQAVVPFALVMLRRELGLSEADLVYTAVATYAGGLVSLYGWGRTVDRFGAARVFQWTCLGMAALIGALVGIGESGGSAAAIAGVGFFFLYSVLSAGFGVADTHVLFGLSPVEAPSRSLVLGSVSVGAASALSPALAGWALDRALIELTDPASRIAVYDAFFVAVALLQLAAWWPLRKLDSPSAAPS